ncbi:ead/Ea22-like family protein [Salmonella enterica subsp. enterica]|nr:ead/Ea22-like family protein [Salmonella enterica subsp. enterica serovar Meleagridis]
MSNIDKQALREAATVATQGGWYVDYDFDVCHESGAFLVETHGDNLVQNAKFIAAANPATVLALLDELAAAERRIAELTESHSKLRDTMATIHNTIRMDGGYTPLAAILNAAKRAYEESATPAGIKVKGE